MRSVTEMLKSMADAKQQFTNIQAGWSQFLHYLNDRHGVGIQGFKRLTEIEQALVYVEENSENLDSPSHDDLTDWFRQFVCREDVLTAFRDFLKHRGLPCP